MTLSADTPHHRRRARFGLAVMCCGGLVLAACGGGESARSESPQPGSVAERTSPAAEPTSRTSEQTPRVNVLSPEESEAGWRLLFDGTSFAGWRGLGRDEIPAGH